MSAGNCAKEWHPERFTLAHVDEYAHFMVIISNQPLENVDLLLTLCSRAKHVIAADGGANRIKDLNLSKEDEEEMGLNMVCGDMDSIRPDVKRYYQSKGVEIIRDPDQYSTDLTKCIRQSRNKIQNLSSEKNKSSQIDAVIFGGLGGRVDQAFSQLQHLYMLTEQEPSWEGDVFLITPESLVFVLDKGLNRIHAPVGAHSFTENASIIPLGKPSCITLRGFEWDVTDWHTEFGGQMSTSNHIKADVVEVECTERVLFTLEYA